MLILSHKLAKAGDQVIAISSSGSFVSVPQIAGGLGPWVIRSPRVPSTWSITQSSLPPVVTQPVFPSTTNIIPIGTTYYGFDLSCEVRLDGEIDLTAAGTACYGAIRFDCISAYIEIGRYKTQFGQTVGVRSNVAGIQSFFGDIPSNLPTYTIRMAKYNKIFLLQCAGRSVTIDTTSANFGQGIINVVSYADSSFNTKFVTTFSSLDLSPAVLVNGGFTDASIINNRVAFDMPQIRSGIYPVIVSGFEIEDTTTIESDDSAPRRLPAARGVDGAILGDNEVR